MVDTSQEQLGGITLPEGYDLGIPPPPPGAAPRDVAPGYDLYGGATVTEATDAAGITYIACCAKQGGGPLYFRVFKVAGSTATEVPLTPLCEGRGSISVNLYTGQVRWVAWQGSTFWRGVVPGSTAFPPLTAGAAGDGAADPLPPRVALPPGVGELTAPGLVISGDQALHCAIDSRGHVYYLDHAALPGVANSGAMRVIHYPPGAVSGSEIPLAFNPNTDGMLLQFGGGIYVVGHHRDAVGLRTLSVPVPGPVLPCQVF